MNLLNNPQFRYLTLTYIAIMTTLVAVLVKFDGNVTVQVTPLSLKVEVQNPSAACPIEPQIRDIPHQIPPQRLAATQIAQLPQKF